MIVQPVVEPMDRFTALLLTLQIVKFDNKSFKIPIDMLLVVELVKLLVVEKLEESLVELRDVVSPVFVELHRHHDQVELPD